PPLALKDDTQIGVYPVSSLKGVFPAGHGVTGGVQFTPEGLLLDFPATLKIDLPANIDPTKIAALAHQGDADLVYLFPFLVQGRSVTVSVTHFSGIDIGDRSLQQSISVLGPETTTAVAAQNDLAAAFLTGQRVHSDPGDVYFGI